jgi:hypothetical protein
MLQYNMYASLERMQALHIACINNSGVMPLTPSQYALARHASEDSTDHKMEGGKTIIT